MLNCGHEDLFACCLRPLRFCLRWDSATRSPASATNAISRRRHKSKPVLIKSRITHTESAAAIDRQVREFLERGESLYSVDFELLRAIEPDLIVTQDLCHVCAATPDDLARGACASGTPAANRDAQSAFSRGCVRGYSRRWAKRRGAPSKPKRLSLNLKERSRKLNATVAGLDRAARSLPRMARSALRGGALGSGNGGARGRDRCSGARGQTVVSRGLGNRACGAARSDRHHAVRLQSCSRVTRSFAACRCRRDGRICRRCGTAACLSSKLPAIFHGPGRAWLRDWRFSPMRSTKGNRMCARLSNPARWLLASPPQVSGFERRPRCKDTI